jgi:hypothetical protein
MSTDNLPTVGFDGDADDTIVRCAILKCIDGRWSAGGEPLARPSGLIALGALDALQRWSGGFPVETIAKRPGEELPDLDALNRAIPEAEWQANPDGTKRPPWSLARVVYLLDPVDGATYTFISATVGAKLAVEGLRDKVRMGRMLHGGGVLPVVTLESRAMKTRYGVKMRPEFSIAAWRAFGPRQQQIEALTTPDDNLPL